MGQSLSVLVEGGEGCPGVAVLVSHLCTHLEIFVINFLENRILDRGEEVAW